AVSAPSSIQWEWRRKGAISEKVPRSNLPFAEIGADVHPSDSVQRPHAHRDLPADGPNTATVGDAGAEVNWGQLAGGEAVSGIASPRPPLPRGEALRRLYGPELASSRPGDRQGPFEAGL